MLNEINFLVFFTKKFISLSIKYTPEIGQGRGPVNHFAYMKKVGLDDE
jgi:hydroxymethylpyrimidine/phosphomethylpyrimidine kinase